MRIAQVAPVATTIPPPKSGSVEQVTAALTDALVARGHDVTLFATADSRTRASLHATFPRGYWHDRDMWPWELYEMMNLAAAVEMGDAFDVIHYQAAYYPISLAFTLLSPIPIVTTVHHTPGQGELALWSSRPDAPFIAVSDWQARRLLGVNVIGTALHGIDLEPFRFRETPDDYVLFLGRFTDGKGVLQAIEVARRAHLPLLLAGARDEYFDRTVAPHVDGSAVSYVGETDVAGKAALFGGARALLYPVIAAEPFGLVLVEAMACGTPVAALDCGAAREVIGEAGGIAFASVDDLCAGLAEVLSLDRRAVREQAVARFSAERMAADHERIYAQLVPPASARTAAR